jgi:hypothetical protein
MYTSMHVQRNLQKASVLPLPVSATLIQSRPDSATGQAWLWIGVGAVKPSLTTCTCMCVSVCLSVTVCVCNIYAYVYVRIYRCMSCLALWLYSCMWYEAVPHELCLCPCVFICICKRRWHISLRFCVYMQKTLNVYVSVYVRVYAKDPGICLTCVLHACNHCSCARIHKHA